MYTVLQNYGIKGRLLNSISALYNSVKLCIKSTNNGNLSDFFNCPLGLRQGCNLSPLLFSLFINELAVDIQNSGVHGIQLFPSVTEIFLLMFADDVALLADTVNGLQRQLNTLERFSDNNNLHVNTEKTKILVFKRGGQLSRREKWFYKNTQLDCVSGFTYVGNYFSSTMSLFKMAEHCAVKAKKVLLLLLKGVLSLPCINSSSFLKIFDTKVVSIMLYGSEIWGMLDMNIIENLHIYACKRFLHTSLFSCNNAVMGDLGRYPIKLTAMKRCMKYWLRILKLSDDRHVKLCYNMLMLYDNHGYENWVTYIRRNLYSNGFGYIWDNQRVHNEELFLKEYVCRLKDQYLQTWTELCASNNKLNKFYVFIKPSFEIESYVNDLDIWKFKSCLANFRCSSHQLMIEKGRHIGLALEDRLCICGDNSIEDEYHFVLICPLYSNLRSTYIAPKYYTAPNLHKFYMLMANKQTEVIRKLAMYLFYANKKRESYLK